MGDFISRGFESSFKQFPVQNPFVPKFEYDEMTMEINLNDKFSFPSHSLPQSIMRCMYIKSSVFGFHVTLHSVAANKRQIFVNTLRLEEEKVAPDHVFFLYFISLLGCCCALLPTTRNSCKTTRSHKFNSTCADTFIDSRLDFSSPLSLFHFYYAIHS